MNDAIDSSGSFRRTLVGLKLSRLRDRIIAWLFQTNPCGVEAERWRPCCSRWSAFQTNLCGVEAPATISTATYSGRFRRTCVGLKLPDGVVRGIRGVVSDEPLGGLKQGCTRNWLSRHSNFRRTLVGLKLQLVEHNRGPGGFRRTLVGFKRG